MSLKGIDVSQHQDTTPSLAGLAFITIRASIGDEADTMYATHYAAARKAGLIVMAYAYGWPTGPISAQVAKFLAVAKDADFLWIDEEEPGFGDADAQAFIDAVRQAGRPCGLYHSSSGFGGVISDGKWVADYRPESMAAGFPRTAPTDGSAPVEIKNWDFWQYQGDPLDKDIANPARPLANLLRRGYVTSAQEDQAYVEGQRVGYDQGVEAGTLSGRRAEWDEQFGTTGTNGIAKIEPGPRP